MFCTRCRSGQTFLKEHALVCVNSDGDVWMEMVQSRNLTSHTYNEDIADEIIRHVQRSYLSQFINLRDKLEKLAEKQRLQVDE